jgi:hypothetical protein
MPKTQSANYSSTALLQPNGHILRPPNATPSQTRLDPNGRIRSPARASFCAIRVVHRPSGAQEADERRSAGPLPESAEQADRYWPFMILKRNHGRDLCILLPTDDYMAMMPTRISMSLTFASLWLHLASRCSHSHQWTLDFFYVAAERLDFCGRALRVSQWYV